MRHLLLLLAASAIAAPAFCNPLNPVVVAGSAAVSQTGNVLTVTNSNGTIINWNKFSIAAGETTRFVQPSASSSVLNRVLNDPSTIYGALTSNGRVWLVNPAGIYVGPGGTVQAAGIFLSTGNIPDADFLGGGTRFEPPPAGSTINAQGQLTAADGIAISADNVRLDGSLVAGNAIDSDARGILHVGGSLAANQLNLDPGNILLPGGNVTLSGGTLNLDGGTVATGSLSLNGNAISIAGTSPGGSLILSSAVPAGNVGIGSGTIAIAGTSSGGSLSLTGGTPAVTVQTGRLLQQAAGAIALRGAPPLAAGNASVVPVATALPARTAIPAARPVNSGALIDGAVTVRLSLVDVAPITLR